MIELKTRLKSSSSLIDLTPLVDVVFLMLIFFMITSDILPLKSLHIENPTLAVDSKPLTTQLLVVMDKEQVIYVGSKKAIVDLDGLKHALQLEIDHLKERHPKSKPTVVLNVDKRVDYGAFFSLLTKVQEISTKVRLVYQYDEFQKELEELSKEELDI